MKYSKYYALGNDYIAIDPKETLNRELNKHCCLFKMKFKALAKYKS